MQLQSYPGYESHHITRLPEYLSVSSQLRRISNAQDDLKKKVNKYSPYRIALLIINNY